METTKTTRGKDAANARKRALIRSLVEQMAQVEASDRVPSPPPPTGVVVPLFTPAQLAARRAAQRKAEIIPFPRG